MSNSHSPDSIRKYLDAIPGAVSGNGGHSQTFSVACALVHGFALPRSEARGYMQEYSRRCDPVWSEREIEHKLTQAETCQTHQKPRGHLISKSVRYTFRDSTPPIVHQSAPLSKPAPKTKRYEPRLDADLPTPMADGARELLKAAFEPGEGVRICIARFNDEKREVPKDEGIVLTREEWLRKLDAQKGDPNGILSNTAKNGIFISINPLKLGGSKDSDVTAFRHALIECDSISQIEQWRHIAGSNVPVTAVISSGGRSVHAWVRVDAQNRREYDERVRLLHEYFAGNGYDIDAKNKNPSRFSRLPNCVRGKARQELLALKVGAESFGVWHADLETDSIGRISTIKDLRKFDATNDPDTLLGDRWICRGGSCLFVGQSGIGKSSLAVQAAITWALGLPFFGIQPKQPLKSLFIQAENDEGDLAEMVQGVLDGLNIEKGSAKEDQVERNVIFVSDASHTGEKFCANLQRLIDKYRPDLAWLDPLLSFIGDDISKQAVCSQFLRTWLGPIQEASGVALFLTHHTGKPSNDPKARQSWTKSDHSYAGIGSSELTNWARAVCLLERVDDDNFGLRLAKRGKRAGARSFVKAEEATDAIGDKTDRIWLQHAPHGIQWLQVAEPPPKAKPMRHKVGGKGESSVPVERDEKHKTPGRPAVLDELRPHLDEFLGMWAIDESLSFNGAAEKLVTFAAKTQIKVGRSKAIEIIKQMVKEAKLTEEKTANGSVISI